MSLRPGPVSLVPLVLFSCLVSIIVGCATPDETASSEADRPALRALEAGDIAWARGDNDAAEAHYRKALEVRPDDARALAGLVRTAIAKGEFEEAVALDDRVRATGGESPRDLVPRERCVLWLDAARARVAARRTDARELVRRLDAEPACAGIDTAQLSAGAFVLDAEAAEASGDTEAAIVAWRAAATADPSLIGVEVRLARMLLDAGHRREALQQLAEALERHPDQAELQMLMLEALGMPTPRTGDAG